MICPSKDYLRKLAQDWQKKAKTKAEAEAADFDLVVLRASASPSFATTDDS